MLRRRQWHPSPVLLPGKSHRRRSLVGCSPWGRKELDTTERLDFHFSLSRIGEGNGNPLQCYCLENPRDGGAWLAAVYGVAQSWTRLKRLSSSSNYMLGTMLCISVYVVSYKSLQKKTVWDTWFYSCFQLKKTEIQRCFELLCQDHSTLLSSKNHIVKPNLSDSKATVLSTRPWYLYLN